MLQNGFVSRELLLLTLLSVSYKEYTLQNHKNIILLLKIKQTSYCKQNTEMLLRWERGLILTWYPFSQHDAEVYVV